MEVFAIFVKLPVPGFVKSRLASRIGAEQAAELYAAFIAEAIERFRTTGGRRLLCYAPGTDPARDYFSKIGGAEFDLWPQPEGDLGTRLARFFAEYLRGPDDRVVVIGSDSPTLPKEYVQQAFELLRDADCVIGPATDGGYYLVGLRGATLPIFAEIEWSTSRVLEQTAAKVAESGARLALLPPWYDVDSPDDCRFLAGHLRALEAAGRSIPPKVARLLRRMEDLLSSD